MLMKSLTQLHWQASPSSMTPPIYPACEHTTRLHTVWAPAMASQSSGERILGCQVFVFVFRFSTLRVQPHCSRSLGLPVSSRFFNPIAAPLAAFKVSWTFVFNSLTVMCLGVIFLVTGRGLLSFWNLWIYMFHYIQKITDIISSRKFSALFSFSFPFKTPVTQVDFWCNFWCHEALLFFFSPRSSSVF